MKKDFDVICIGAALVDLLAQIERHPLEDDEVFDNTAGMGLPSHGMFH